MTHSSEIPTDAGNPAIGRRRLIGRLAALVTLSLVGAACVPQPNPNNPDELPEWSAYRRRGRQGSGNRGDGHGGRR